MHGGFHGGYPKKAGWFLLGNLRFINGWFGGKTSIYLTGVFFMANGSWGCCGASGSQLMVATTRVIATNSLNPNVVNPIQNHTHFLPEGFTTSNFELGIITGVFTWTHRCAIPEVVSLSLGLFRPWCFISVHFPWINGHFRILKWRYLPYKRPM